MTERAVVFASGTKEGGGTGFENLFRYAHAEGSSASYRIAAVVSNHEHGGVRERADKLGVPFVHFPAPWSAERYRSILTEHSAEWALLSGWLKRTVGLEPAKTINIHPALLSVLEGRLGGEGLYGHRVHEAVKRAVDAGELSEWQEKNGVPYRVAHSGFTMHFVTDEYDKGPIICEVPVVIEEGMSAKEIGERVRTAERMWQPMLTDMVVSGKISLKGKCVIVPSGFCRLYK